MTDGHGEGICRKERPERGEGIKGVGTDGHGEGIWSRERPER